MVQVWHSPQEAAVAASALFELGSMDSMSPWLRVTPSLATAFALLCNRWAGSLSHTCDCQVRASLLRPCLSAPVFVRYLLVCDHLLIRRIREQLSAPCSRGHRLPSRERSPLLPHLHHWVFSFVGMYGLRMPAKQIDAIVSDVALRELHDGCQPCGPEQVSHSKRSMR